MTQVTDYAVANGPRAEVRLKFNAVLAALRDDNAGPTPPPNPVPFMIWKDTSGGGEGVYRVMNAAGSAWMLLIDALQPDKIAALESLATGSALRQLTRAHWDRSLPMNLGVNDWRGAADVNNTVFYPASQTVFGITSSIEGRGYLADGTPFFDVRVAGTVSGGASSVSVAYLSTAGLIPLPAAQRTASVIIRKTGGTGAVSLRAALTEVGGANPGTTNGNSVNASTDTLSSATRSTGGGSVRCGIGWVASDGSVLNDTFRILGPQLELGPVRTNLSFKEVGFTDALRAMGAGRRLIKSFTVASVASVDFSSALLSAPSGVYEVVLDGIVPATSGAFLRLRTSTDNGATFASTAGDYSFAYALANSADSVAGDGSPNGTAIPIHTQGAANSSAMGVCGGIMVFGAGQARHLHVTSKVVYERNDGAFMTEDGGGKRNSTGVVNAIRLDASSGNLSTGTISLYEVIR